MYEAKCGHTDEKDSQEMGEIICTTIGCEICKFKTGTIYYPKDVEKGVEMFWEIIKNDKYGYDGNNDKSRCGC